jgi:NAD+ diphosphatase
MPENFLFLFDRNYGDVLVPNGENEKFLECEKLREYEKLNLIEASGKVKRNSSSDVWAIIKEGASPPPGFKFTDRRSLADSQGIEIFERSGMAFQMMSLFANNRFCGKCGVSMGDGVQFGERRCPVCGRIVYPSLSPAVIVAVERDGKLLLAHNANFEPRRYSLVAGFVEPGETLEETVAREVLEETKIRIKNIRYWGSQTWPFPASMMFGFVSEWESGEPSPDGVEILDAGWYAPNALPGLPPVISIARKIIDDWIERSKLRA